MTSSSTTTEYTASDISGRVTKTKQTTDGTAYDEMEYAYNLSGGLIETKYPSGRVVKNVLDEDGKLSMVQSKKNSNYGYWDYAKNFSYTTAGGVSDLGRKATVSSEPSARKRGNNGQTDRGRPNETSVSAGGPK